MGETDEIIPEETDEIIAEETDEIISSSNRFSEIPNDFQARRMIPPGARELMDESSESSEEDNGCLTFSRNYKGKENVEKNKKKNLEEKRREKTAKTLSRHDITERLPAPVGIDFFNIGRGKASKAKKTTRGRK